MSVQPSSVHLLTADEVADRLRVARAFVYRHAEELGALKVGSHLRFREGDVEEWLSAQRLSKTEPSASVQPFFGRAESGSRPRG